MWKIYMVQYFSPYITINLSSLVSQYFFAYFYKEQLFCFSLFILFTTILNALHYVLSVLLTPLDRPTPSMLSKTNPAEMWMHLPFYFLFLPSFWLTTFSHGPFWYPFLSPSPKTCEDVDCLPSRSEPLGFFIFDPHPASHLHQRFCLHLHLPLLYLIPLTLLAQVQQL